MYSILQDVDNIMYNQLSDIFELPQWVVNVATLFSLKICDDLEWKNFSKHYNHETGEVITSKPPYESIHPTHNTDMTDADRDKLSKAHTDLTTMNTTIKNLLEAVINFSCTGNVSTHQPEKTVETHLPTPKQTPPTSNSAPMTHWIKSANPSVIKPTHNLVPNTKQLSPDTPTKPKANPHHLILQFNPPIPELKWKNADAA